MTKIIIASKNPVKINATAQGFQQLFPSLKQELASFAVPSGVADQPRSEEETLLGAQNRVEVIKQLAPNADFWIGIEGGIAAHGDEMAAFAWIVIHSTKFKSKARTGTFFLPPPIVALLKEGKELGEADDLVFGSTNSKQNSGAVGLLTDDLINRTSLYVHAVVLALIPFKNESLYLKSPDLDTKN